MKKILSVMLVGLMLAPFCMAQNENDISLPEFRQCLMDMLVVLNARQQADYAKILPAMTDTQLAQIYKGVQDGKRFQQAARFIHDAAKNGGMRRRSSGAPAASMVGAPAVKKAPGFQIDTAVSPRLFPPIGTPTLPNIGLATPPYPFGTGSWHDMVTSIPSGELTSADLSSAICTPDYLSAMTTAVSAFHSAKDAGDAICEIVPDIFVEILGEGASIPAKEICYLIVLIVGAFDSAFEGFLADCDLQGELVAAAEGNAAYLNTIALFNQKFRLRVEQNLQSTTPVATYELPSSAGGYLDSVRAVVATTIANMQSIGLNEAAALSQLSLGDGYYNAGQYKTAYASYRKAYALATN